MIRLLTIIGARPQIIKSAALSRAIKRWNASVCQKGCSCEIEEIVLHTGQHYDDNLSGNFFSELNLPVPQINLHVGSASHGVQIARMIEGIESVLMASKFDGVVLYGDTNSTLAGTVAASKLHIPIFHIEGGLRSGNMDMPEEINRIVCDKLSSLLFVPTQTGMVNLCQEGFCGEMNIEGLYRELKSNISFGKGKKQRAILSGDVMYDNALYYGQIATQKSDVIARLGLAQERFILVTIHRPVNTDLEAHLTAIFQALMEIASGGVTQGIKVVVPLHPRTRSMMQEKVAAGIREQLATHPNVVLTDPMGFLDILCLEKYASVVITDSGGVQKEAFFFETPTIILREETEWLEILDAGGAILSGADCSRIVLAYEQLRQRKVTFPPVFGDGHAADQILADIVNYVTQ